MTTNKSSDGKMDALTLHDRLLEWTLAHPEESKKSALEINRDIHDSPLRYKVPHGKSEIEMVTSTLQIPKVFDEDDRKNFEKICETTYRIFEKTIQAYRRDPAIRKLFGFTPELNRLILLDPGYPIAVPMLRVDIFYDEKTKDFKFCEFNTDGTSAMFENDLMKTFMNHNAAWQALKPEAESMELMNSWADAFLKVYSLSGNPKEKPSIVITDFLENSYYPELQAFERLFTERGYFCEICDIRDLDYDGQRLFSSKTGTRYDVIYRRAVTSDVMHDYHNVLPFLMAIEHRDVVCIGSFQTQIPHSKAINEVLQSSLMQSYLDPEEIDFIRQHLPQTFDLTRKTLPLLEEDKDRWIIKPKDSYAAKGVWAGIDVPQRLWKKLLHDFADTDYIAQEYIHHYQSENIDPVHQDHPGKYSNLSGLYVYNGKFAGVYSRLSASGIISTQYNEKMVPTFFLKSKV